MALLNRGWGALSGLVIIAAAPAFLSSTELGTYYAFSSLLGLQIFFDLGFNYVVMQVAAGEAAKIELDAAGHMKDSVPRQRAVSLIRLLVRWYSIAASIFLVAVIGGGWVFFKGANMDGVSWHGPWFAITILTSVNLFLGPFLSIDEAFGRVHDVARIRLICGVCGTALFVIALACGLRLWSIPFYVLPLSLGATLWLRSAGSVLPQMRCASVAADAARISWRKEIFPFQWRLSLSWVSGYFIYQLITPTIFRISGPIEAARFGLALAICNGFLGFGVAWLNALGPSLVKAVEDGEFDRLNALLTRGLKWSSLLLLAAFLGVTVLPFLSTFAWLKLAAKLPSWHVLALLSCATLANHVVYGMATYLRAFRVEVLTAASLTSAVFTATGVMIAANIAPSMIPAVYCISICMLLLPWTTYLYISKKRSMAK